MGDGYMGYYGVYDYSEYSTDDQREVLYEQIGFGSAPGDPELHRMFYDYYYNDFITLEQRMVIYDRMVDHLEEYYGIDFNDTWDWEAFKEWYG